MEQNGAGPDGPISVFLADDNLIVREGVRQNLQRDLATEFGVFRAIDLAHAACADLRDDVVDAETGAGCEDQTAGSIAVSAP